MQSGSTLLQMRRAFLISLGFAGLLVAASWLALTPDEADAYASLQPGHLGSLALDRAMADTAASSSAKSVATCRGLPATIVGTRGNDVIQGTPARDVITGLEGDDTIYGHGENDVICGGENEGTTFSNFFLSTPSCCPSRSTILRGQYTHNHQIRWNGPPEGGYEKFRDLGHESSTIATWFQHAGYRTALFGKYINGYPVTTADLTYVPPGWDEWYAKLTFGDRRLPCSDCRGNPRAFFNYQDNEYQNNENGRVVSYGSAPEDYEVDVMVRQVVSFIERTAADGAPFFMYLSPFAPHLPATPAPRHQDRFPYAQLPRPPSF